MTCSTALLLKHAPLEAHGLISQMQTTLQKHDVVIHVTTEKQVKTQTDDLGCAGYFDSEPLSFAVAIGKPFNDWFKVYLHEYSHFEQWLEDVQTFNEKTVDIAQLFSWVEGKIELSEARLKACTQSAIWIEYDCEKRVLEKIKREALNHLVCPFEYAQLANAYFNFYLYVAQTKAWYRPLHEPYTLKAVYSLFPTHLVELKALTPELEKAYALCV